MCIAIIGIALIVLTEASKKGAEHGRAMATGSPAVAVQPSWTDVGIVTDVQPVWSTLNSRRESMVKTDYGDFIWVDDAVNISDGQAHAAVCPSLGQIRISNAGDQHVKIYNYEVNR
jgi:hypothetical protein